MPTSTTSDTKVKIITPVCHLCGDKGEKKVKTHYLDKNGWVCNNCYFEDFFNKR